MNTELAIVLLLLAAAIAMFAVNKPRMDVVALITLTVLPFTGSITMTEALAGFSDANVILIAALFVIGEGLIRTGVVRRLGDWLTTKAGSSEIRLIVLLMVAVSAFGCSNEFDRRHRDLRPGGAAHRPKDRYLTEPVDDASVLRCSDQRNVDAGRYHPQPGRQQRACARGQRRVSLLQFHAFRLADPRSGNHLYDHRPPMARRQQRTERSRGWPPEPARLDQGVQTR